MNTKKAFACLFSAITLAVTALTGCGTENEIKSNAPDYSKSQKEYTIWSFGGTCDDWYQVAGQKYYFEDGTRQTPERTKLYADGGFNVLFIDWTFTYNGTSKNDFLKSATKLVMDRAHEQGLKCVVFVSVLHTLSSSHTSLIVGEGKGDGKNTFDSQAELNLYVEKALAGVIEHPAFYGVSLIDEPYYTQFDAMSEVYKAVQAAVPGAWCNMNLNPMSYDPRAVMRYTEGANKKYGQYVLPDNTLAKNYPKPSVDEVRGYYTQYLEAYYEKLGKYCQYVQYDSYPLLNAKSNDFDYSVLKEHMNNAQLVAEFCKKTGMGFGHVYQTQSGYSRRASTKTDMYWQVNIGMAFGVKNHSYYTYYPTVNASELPDETSHIVNRVGDPNPLYYWLKDIHQEMQFNAKALMNFEYTASTYRLNGEYEWNDEYMTRLTQYALTDVREITVEGDGAVLVTEQYDKANQQRGYYVMNATDPLYLTEMKVTLYIDGFDMMQVYNGKKIEEKEVKNGKISFYLPTGQGVFVMPYNK